MFVLDILIVIVTWVQISLKYARRSSGQEEVVQLGDVDRGFGRHTDGQKVIVVYLGCFSA